MLEAQETRTITIYLTVTENNLRNLAENTMNFELSLQVDGDIDKTSSNAYVNMVKIDPIEEGPDAGKIAGLAGNILFILIGLIIFSVILVVTFRIVRSASSPLEELSSFDDYDYAQGNTFNSGSLPGAPELPSSDKIANSMYGGSKEIFEQPPPPLNIPTEEPTVIEQAPVEEMVGDESVDDVNEEQIVSAAGVPPVPENGLPEGWTMDQWVHYGQAWLDQQN